MTPRLLLAGFMVLLCILCSTARAQTIADYQFTAGTGTPTDMSTGTTTIIGNAVDDGSSGTQNIGFTFRFANTNYTQYAVSSNGAMILGSGAVATTFTNNLTASLPMIASFFDDHHTSVFDGNGYVKARLTGSAPNRVLTIEWRVRSFGSSLGNAGEIYQWQCRLYETTNAIDFLYMIMRTDRATSASFGIAATATANDFISVTPGTPPTISRTVINNSANVGSVTTALPFGTRWAFTPCNANISLLPNPGGSGSGGGGGSGADTLLANVSVMRGSRTNNSPQRAGITLANPACAPRNYTYSITGTYAGDYTVTPASGTLTGGQSVTPQITFRPTGTGVREARLTVTDDNGFSRSFILRAKGLTRINWIGNLTQAGTATVASGDTLLNGSKVTYGTSKTFTPLTLENINLDPQATPPASITYILNDPTGHYSITPASASINGGIQSIPQITFNALGDVGYQEATLTVTADGEVRTYLLRAFNAAPGGELYTGGNRITRTTPLFVNQSGCVGVDILSLEIEAFNTGAGDFVVRGAEIFANDTVVGPGSPPYPVLRDQGGQPIRSIDYFLSNAPGVVPKGNNPSFDSLVIPEGGRRTFYLNVIPTRPGKRFATVYINTNGFNMSDPNVYGVPTRGVMQAAVFARGNSAILNSDEFGKRPTPLTLQTTDVRESRTITAWLGNNGDCDLRISRSKLRLESGDVDEFALLSILPNTTVVGDEYVLPPGAKDSVVIEFSPETYGSRRATIHLATNDSTLGTAGGAERGVFYWDVFGTGRIGLEARGVRLKPSVIGGESSKGFITFTNTSGGVAEIESLTIVGANGEIIEDATQPWPARPLLLNPGEEIRLWVELKPDPGASPGVRNAEVVARLRGGAEARARVNGYAGTRLVSVVPGTLFNDVTIGVGEFVRKYVSIINIGTLPLRLDDPVLTETNPGDYRVGVMTHRTLEPGQTMLLEVTYTPQLVGASSGTLSFGSDATNGMPIVELGGQGTSGTAIGTPGGSSITVRGPGETNATGKQSVNGGLRMIGVTPNPARDQVAVVYGVAELGAVEIELYDLSGKRVWTRSEGTRTAGEHRLEFNVTGLSAGTYHCVVRQREESVSYVVRIVN